ncbi:MAG: DNA-directed DNA polymerase II small subunit, partial [Candidatus Hydrothermarchaeales archaeon]
HEDHQCKGLYNQDQQPSIEEKFMEDFEILNIFIEQELNIHPAALSEIRKRGDTDKRIDEIISRIQKSKVKPSIITLEYINSMGDKDGQEIKATEGGDDEVIAKEPLTDGIVPGGQSQGFNEIQPKFNEYEVVVKKTTKRFLAEEYEPEIKINEGKDITNKSFSEGDIEGFVEYFNDRYEKIAKILRERNHLRDAATIERIKSSIYRENLRVIGIVNDVRKSRKGNTIIELEDPTGVIPVIVLSTNSELVDISKSVVKDEVIGIEGNGGKDNQIIIAREIFFPDLPINREPNRSEDPLALATMSDTHVGSTEFLDDVFRRFIKWLQGDMGSKSQKILAGRVKYLMICGDLVDGVGIYPGQEEELVTKDIHEQYEKFGEFIKDVPEHIEIIIIPGNHDATRQAEPQPAIFEQHAPKLYEDPRIRMVGNPCHATIHGVNILSYHGRSLDDIISAIPEMSYADPEKPMIELLRKRHLSPIFGGKVPLSPEAEDHMFIDDMPDILHFGHVHTVGAANYRGTTIINSGTFQKQTSFQRRLNMHPDPGKVPIIDLQSHKTTIMKFM